jgi:hypothetical protein
MTNLLGAYGRFAFPASPLAAFVPPRKLFKNYRIVEARTHLGVSILGAETQLRENLQDGADVAGVSLVSPYLSRDLQLPADELQLGDDGLLLEDVHAWKEDMSVDPIHAWKNDGSGMLHVLAIIEASSIKACVIGPDGESPAESERSVTIDRSRITSLATSPPWMLNVAQSLAKKSVIVTRGRITSFVTSRWLLSVAQTLSTRYGDIPVYVTPRDLVSS